MAQKEGAAPTPASVSETASPASLNNYSISAGQTANNKILDWREFDSHELYSTLMSSVVLDATLVVGAPSTDDLETAADLRQQYGDDFIEAQPPVQAETQLVDGPEQAYGRLAHAIVERLGAENMEAREFDSLYDCLCHSHADRWYLAVHEDEESGAIRSARWLPTGEGAPGYQEFYRSCIGKIGRVPPDARIYACAVYDAARFASQGCPLAFIDDQLAMHNPACNDTSEAPYSLVSRKQLLRMLRRHGKHLNDRQADLYLSFLRGLVPDIQTSETMSPFECPIKNGMLDRRTMTVRPYTPEDYRLGKYARIYLPTDDEGRVLPVEEPRIERPDGTTWSPRTWFEETMTDPDGRLALLAMLICFMFPGIALEKAFILFGLGRNGKGTFLAMMRAMIGGRTEQARYISNLTFDDFSHEYNRAQLFGKLANLCDEVEPDAFVKKLAHLKATISHDPITGRNPYEGVMSWAPMMSLVFCLNSELKTPEQTAAIYERFVFVAFPESFARREGGVDPRIKQDYMQRECVTSYFAYVALTEVPMFTTSEIFDTNPYVIRCGEENRATANPTYRAWSLVEDFFEGIHALPVKVVRDLLANAKSDYEGDAGKLPSALSRSFRDNLVAASGDFVIPRTEDGRHNERLDVKRWLKSNDRNAMEALFARFGDEKLRGWLEKCKEAQPGGNDIPRERSWLVRRDDWEHFEQTGETPAERESRETYDVKKARRDTLTEQYREYIRDVVGRFMRREDFIVEDPYGQYRRYHVGGRIHDVELRFERDGSGRVSEAYEIGVEPPIEERYVGYQNVVYCGLNDDLSAVREPYPDEHTRRLPADTVPASRAPHEYAAPLDHRPGRRLIVTGVYDDDPLRGRGLYVEPGPTLEELPIPSLAKWLKDAHYKWLCMPIRRVRDNVVLPPYSVYSVPGWRPTPLLPAAGGTS